MRLKSFAVLEKAILVKRPLSTRTRTCLATPLCTSWEMGDDNLELTLLDPTCDGLQFG